MFTFPSDWWHPLLATVPALFQGLWKTWVCRGLPPACMRQFTEEMLRSRYSSKLKHLEYVWIPLRYQESTAPLGHMVMTTIDFARSLRIWVLENRINNSACFLIPYTQSRCNNAIENEMYVDGFVEQGSREGCGPCSWEVKVLLLQIQSSFIINRNTSFEGKCMCYFRLPEFRCTAVLGLLRNLPKPVQMFIVWSRSWLPVLCLWLGLLTSAFPWSSSPRAQRLLLPGHHYSFCLVGWACSYWPQCWVSTSSHTHTYSKEICGNVLACHQAAW